MFQMKSAIILAAGKGRKIWPYSEVRSKTMIRVSNKPILAYSIEALLESGLMTSLLLLRIIEEIELFCRNGESHCLWKGPPGTAFLSSVWAAIY